MHASKRPQSGFFANGNGTRGIANEDGNIRLIDSRLLLIAYSPIAYSVPSLARSPSLSLCPGECMAFPCNRLAALQTHRDDGRRRVERGEGPAINVYGQLIEIYVLIHSRIGGAGEQIVPAIRPPFERTAENRWNEAKVRKRVGEAEVISFLCLLLIYSDVPRLSAS